MAEDVMGEIAAELHERYELCAVAIHHRIGRVDIGETSVVIAVSAPHRQDALAACKDAIDTLKDACRSGKKSLRGRRGMDRARIVSEYPDYNPIQPGGTNWRAVGGACSAR
jgi:Molybdopterin converting factor, large subunit